MPREATQERGGIDHLRPADIPEAARLLALINQGVTRSDLEGGLAWMLRNWPELQLVARGPDGKLQGIITGALDRSDPRIGWSHDLVIAPEHRAHGIGSRLLNAQIDAFRSLGCQAIRGQSPAWLSSALPFFLRHGFRVIDRTVARGQWGIADGQELWTTELPLAPGAASVGKV